jgi:hypothetical protein
VATESPEDWDNLLLEDEWLGHQAAEDGLDDLVNHAWYCQDE